MKKMRISEKTIFLFLAVIIVFVVFVVISLARNNTSLEEEKEELNVVALADENRFATIKSAIDSYVLSVKYDDVDTLIVILDKKYVQNNKINRSNVLDVIEKYNSNYIVDVRRVYQIKKYNNIYIYYVKAKLAEEYYDSFIQEYIKDVYYQVTINENTLAFSIAPITSQEYMSKVGDLNE